MIKEIRINDDEQHIPREIVIKVKKFQIFILLEKNKIFIFQATTEKLLDLLVDEQQLIDDPNYVQDFLLTYRTRSIYSAWTTGVQEFTDEYCLLLR